MQVIAEDFRKWWDVFHRDDSVVELRLLGRYNGRPKQTFSGYFTNPEDALNALREFDGDEMNVYSPFNRLKDACRGKYQMGKIAKVDNTTSDREIEMRQWVMFDFDPERPTDTNSTKEERAYARNKMKEVGIFLRNNGWSAPVVVMSGNGYHLMYKVDLKNSTENTKLIEGVLKVMDLFFSDDKCKIDTANSNAARITKVVGCRAVKGSDQPDRPQRMVAFERWLEPDEVAVTSWESLCKIAAMQPVEIEKPSSFNGYRDSFDVEDFLTRHNIGIDSRIEGKDYTKIILKECPFDASHKAPDSAIFIMRSGAIGFKCLHNSCAAYTWRDVRLHYEPDSYSRREQDEYWRRRDFYSQAPRPAPVIIDENAEKGKKWQNMSDIVWQDPNLLTYIPTGIDEIDKVMKGLALTDMTVLSGITGSGKTSLINMFLLSALGHGYKAAVFSGEVSPSRFKNWFNQMAAGRNRVVKGHGNTEYYYAPLNVVKEIDKWTNNNLFLYNTNYGYKVSQLVADIKDCINTNGTQLVIIDNKMVIEMDEFGGDSNQVDSAFVNTLNDLARNAQVHILLVVHPRKEQLNSLIRRESISGSSNIINTAANILLCHRVNRDFDKRAREFFPSSVLLEISEKGYSSVIEIAKNRYPNGVQDVLAGLYYEKETKRYLNYPEEYKTYGWEEEPKQQTLDLNDDEEIDDLPY